MHGCIQENMAPQMAPQDRVFDGDEHTHRPCLAQGQAAGKRVRVERRRRFDVAPDPGDEAPFLASRDTTPFG